MKNLILIGSVLLAQWSLATEVTNAHAQRTETPATHGSPTNAALPKAPNLDSHSTTNSEVSPSVGTNQVRATTSSTNEPAGTDDTGAINPALLHSSHLIASSNLTVGVHRPVTSAEPDYQQRLDFAIQLRRQKNLAQANQQLIALVESEASEEIRKTALLELALVAQDDNKFARAQQIFSQYLSRYPKDVSAPEIMLRQGLLYRRMGANTLAVGKFYSVMSAGLTLKTADFDYNRRLVLQAQSEIAETYYQQGSYADSAEYLERLLKLDSPGLNKPLIRYKLIRSRAALGEHPEVIVAAGDFLQDYPEAGERAEVRFLLAKSLQILNRADEALKELAILLKDQDSAGATNQATWVYWQQRIGNEIANQLYQQGDYINALNLYLHLASLDASPAWQIPIQYQIGLAYERLQQPDKAIETYAGIGAREKELASDPAPDLKTVFDMARWREQFLKWQTQIETSGRTNKSVQVSASQQKSPP